MKKLYTFITLIVLSFSAFAQVPQKMSYQAVVRDASEALVVSTAVGMQISILQGSAVGTAVYIETHTTSTNANGLVSIEIGSGSVVLGNFSAIDWSTGNYYIKTETDLSGGTAYTISGTTQLLSVPYAMYAGNAAGNLGNGSAAGNTPYWNGSNWVTNSSNLYNNGGNIGIGNTNPTTARLVIAGPNGLDLSTADSYANMRVIQNTNGVIDKDLYLGYNSGTTSSLHLFSNNSETITVRDNKVGINMNNPSAQLQLADAFSAGGKNLQIGDDSYLSDVDVPNVLGIYGVQNSDRGAIKLGSTGPEVWGLNNNIGIGNNNPTAKLDIAGTLKIVDGTQGAGKVLTSDANGLASWATPAPAPAFYNLSSFWNGTTPQPSAPFTIGNSGTMVTFAIYNNCAQGQVFGGTMLIDPAGNVTIINYANVLTGSTMTATGNVITLNSGCGSITMTFNVSGTSCTITTGGVTNAITQAKLTVLTF